MPPKARNVQLNLKVARNVRQQGATSLFAGAPGIESVTQTFPDETDDDLSRLYVLEVLPSELDAALKTLRRNPAVEYVEPAASRRPLR